jgi:hypothetical protein
VFYYCGFFFFLVCLLYYCGFFIFFLNYLLIPILTPFTLPPSPVLQSIVFLSNYSFCPFSSTLSPCALTIPSCSPPTCHQTGPPSYTLTTCWPNYYTNFTQPQLPIIPDTSTLHNNNRNIPKHTQGPQNLTVPTSFPHSPTPLPTSSFSATLNNFPNFYS